ncbi:MAG: response regulator [Candidatus Scalinduaceae bacterium]
MKSRILLVDDEETLRYVLRETLINEGYMVDIAKDGFQALERFRQEPYDLIITDIKMHGMDGLQLIRKIKKDNSDLKIIIITAYGSLETVKEAMRLGVVEFISKPFKLQEIKDGITRSLCDYNTLSDFDNNPTQFRVKDNEQLSITDNLLVPTGLSYYFGGPASQPKSTVFFDFVAINKNRAVLIFGNVNSQDGKCKEWWENRQMGIMIKTLFRSKIRNSPKKTIDDINNFLYKNVLPHINVSMLCAHVNKRKKNISYVNCGNNLVCSVFAPNGQVEIMESFHSLLGNSPKIETFERFVPYSNESRLVLSSSDTVSNIKEKGGLIKQAVEGVVQSVKSSQKRQSKEIDLCSSFASNNRDINFDEETVLLMSLDWDCVQMQDSLN